MDNSSNIDYIDPYWIYKHLKVADNDIKIFKKFISVTSSNEFHLHETRPLNWEPVFSHMLELMSNTEKMGQEKSLLASQAFFTLLITQYESYFVTDFLLNVIKEMSDIIFLIGKQYQIADGELFKLIVMHGYLKVNHNKDDVNIIYERMWLEATMTTDIWSTNNFNLEEKLEAIVFSNWSNAINDISKQNALSIFNLYLKIMQKEYNGFLKYIFEHCLNSISWQDEIKYTILAEICKISHDAASVMTLRYYLLCLSTCLTKTYLRSSGTKVYMAILKGLTEDDWKEKFGPVIQHLINQWESGPKFDCSALQSLCKFWLEPAFIRYKSTLPFIWGLCKDSASDFVKLYLHRIASEMNILLPLDMKIIYHNINDKNEVVRLNAFAISCCRIRGLLLEVNAFEILEVIKKFLWCNANASTLFLRDGMVKYFRRFFAELLQIYCATNTDINKLIKETLDWIKEFIVDCFEIGSCYQRKILGLNLYKSVLSFMESSMLFDSKVKMHKQSFLLKNRLHVERINETIRGYINRNSLFLLLRLTLDTASDVKHLSNVIILDSFNRDMLSSFEMEVLSNNAMEYCNSFKFYEIESGSELLQILANWNENPKLLGELLLEIAKSQLSEIKSDILKAIIEKKPLFGILNAILKVAYQGNSQICQKDVVFSEKIMCILEEITNFYLSVLSSRAESNGYASSFAEMGMAIEESIRNSQIDDDNKSELSLSPSHQLLVSCIWMTFKISCELAAEIGILMHSDSLVNRTMNLISKVLLKCRHKGAVEAAGVAINHLSRHLHNNENYAELPKIYVEKLLENETTSTLNLTRRGAGLTIMFHKIIISDNRRDRPLLHSTVNVLLQLLNENFEISTKHINCNFDMPCARQLHFLHSLVADKEIHAHLVSYMESISLTCFKFMSSEVWVIRNASLQLYGALVPRLVGQNVGGRSLDYGNGYPINHFVTHYPRLARHVMTELNKFSSLPGNDSAFLLEYSSIVHILILLSKMSCGGCDLIDYSSEEYILDIKKNLLKLFGNSIVYIRHFAAKAYASFTPLSSVQFEINALDSSLNDKSSNNLLHGKLLAIHYLCKRFLNGIESMNPRQIKNIRAEVRQCKILSKCQSILQAWSKIDYMHKENEPFCYTLETILLEMSEFKFSSNEALLLDRSMLFIDQLVRTERMKPGFSTFFESLIRLYANYIKEKPNTVNANTLNAILNSKYISESITLLDNLTGFSPLVEFISKYLLLRIHDSKDTLINIMIMHFVNLLRKSSSSSYKLDESISMLMDKVENCESINFQLSHFRNILAIVSCKNQETLNKTLSHVLDSTISKEERTRILAVECLEFAAKHYLKLNSEQKLYVLYSSLFLLKDENVEIRESISNILQINLLPKLCNDTVSSQHSEVLYESLLNNLFQSLSFETNSSVVMFHANIIERFTMICPLKDNLIIKSPFDHEDDDCYKEESKLFNHLYYMIGEGATKTNLNNKDKIQLNLFNTFQVHKCGIEEGFYIEFDNLQDCLTFKSTDYLLKKKNIILNKIRYRNQIIHLNIEK